MPRRYAAFNRAVREAVRRVNANKRAYLHYFIDYYKDRDPEVAKMTIDDLREGRIYLVDPAPIPADELQRTFDWMKSWGFLEDVCEAKSAHHIRMCSIALTKRRRTNLLSP